MDVPLSQGGLGICPSVLQIKWSWVDLAMQLLWSNEGRCQTHPEGDLGLIAAIFRGDLALLAVGGSCILSKTLGATYVKP